MTGPSHVSSKDTEETRPTPGLPPKPPTVTVLALDPGVTTGYCLATLQDDRLYIAPGEAHLTLLEIDTILLSLVGLHNDAKVHIIYEDFTFRIGSSRTGLDFTPARIQGVIELYREKFEPLVGFDKQVPSVQGNKAFYSDNRLKQLGVYWGHGKGHARSATKHLLHWLNFGAGGKYVDVTRVQMEIVDERWMMEEFYEGMRLVA